MEPTLSQIDDFSNHESPKKRKAVLFIVIGILTLSALLSAVKYYYDFHTPDCFNPIVTK
jgi:hypothetical protein